MSFGFTPPVLITPHPLLTKNSQCTTLVKRIVKAMNLAVACGNQEGDKAMKWVWILVALAAPVVIWVNPSWRVAPPIPLFDRVGISMPVFIVLVIGLSFVSLSRAMRKSSLRDGEAARVKAGIVSPPDKELSGLFYLALHKQEAKLIVAPPGCAIALADIRGINIDDDGMMIETADAQNPQVRVGIDLDTAWDWGGAISTAAIDGGNPLRWEQP